MKVLFLVNLPSPYRVLFFTELGKLCDLTVVYERDSASDRNPLWKAKSKETYKEIFLQGKKIGTENSLSFQIINVLKKEQYDKYVIGMYSTFTAMLAIGYLKFNKIPFILSTDGGFVKNQERWIKYKCKKNLIGAADAWLSTGENTNQYLIHYGAHKKRIYQYPFTSLLKSDLENASLLSQNSKYFLRKKIGIGEEKVLLSVGRFSHNTGYRKGYDTLLKVAEKLSPTVGIYIVGEEPTEEFLILKEKMHLSNVHYVGFKEKKDLAEYYAMADIFILLTREDIWGLVINEAMSFGLPIITTYQCMAGLELVQPGENGYLVDCEDVNTSVYYINTLLDNDSLCNRMRKQCLKKIKNYTIENMAYIHMEHLKKI